MKIIKIILLLILFSSCKEPINSGKKTNINDISGAAIQNENNVELNVVLSKDKFTINDLKVDSLTTINDLEKVIGISTRKIIRNSEELKRQIDENESISYNIYTYDNLGFLVYENPLTKRIRSIDFEFEIRNFEFSSNISFDGQVSINNAIFIKGISYDDIIKISQIQIKQVAPKIFNLQNIKNKVYLEFQSNKKLKLLSISTNVFDESDKENSFGWTMKLIEKSKKQLLNEVKLIEISKLKGFDIDKFVDCYFNKISKTLTPLQIITRDKNIKAIISKISIECQNQSKN